MFPFGATLNVVKPAISVLSSGSVSFPLNRPVCAFHSSRVSSFQVYNSYVFVFLTLQWDRSLKTCCNHFSDSYHGCWIYESLTAANMLGKLIWIIIFYFFLKFRTHWGETVSGVELGCSLRPKQSREQPCCNLNLGRTTHPNLSFFPPGYFSVVLFHFYLFINFKGIFLLLSIQKEKWLSWGLCTCSVINILTKKKMLKFR